MKSTHAIELNKLCERSIVKMTDAEAIDHIGNLIDMSFDASFHRGAKRALFLLDELSKRDLTGEDEVNVEYYRANAWNAFSHSAENELSGAWESTERQEELLALSRALNHCCFSQINKIWQCRILTNHANVLNSVGRFIDAIALYDRALQIIPNFAMAHIDRGFALKTYADLIDDDYERAVITLHAHDSFLVVSANNTIFDFDNEHFLLNTSMYWVQSLANDIDITVVRSIQNLDIGPQNQTKKELVYRNWCLDNRLFLSPINDLGPYWAAPYDDLVISTISEKINERTDEHLPPPIIGFFNQIKQEYVSVRFTLFEGLSSNKVHYSDNNVALSDTLDYPLYSLASERIRMAFRIAYSLLDKIAYLVNHYWALNKKLDRISFKNIWMVENKKHLLPQFEKLDNLPLRGLFWLSKELFDEDIKATTSADAKDLHTIRNALEHSYLRVIEGWAKPFMSPETRDSSLGITFGSDAIETKAIRIMQIARMAILYVSFAISIEGKKNTLLN